MLFPFSTTLPPIPDNSGLEVIENSESLKKNFKRPEDEQTTDILETQVENGSGTPQVPVQSEEEQSGDKDATDREIDNE